MGLQYPDELKNLAAITGSQQALAIAPHLHAINNDWGAQYEVYEQVVFANLGGAPSPIAGWAWERQGVGDKVLGYPEIIVGRKPWQATGTKHPAFPKPIEALNELTVDFSCSFIPNANARANLAFDCWLLTTSDGGEADIKAEVMLWSAERGGARPAGGPYHSYGIWKEAKPFGHPNFRDWELWVKRGDPNRDNGWPVYTFIPCGAPFFGGNVDIASGLRFLADAGLLDPKLYLIGLEFGSEIFGGSGKVIVHSFDIRS